MDVGNGRLSVPPEQHTRYFEGKPTIAELDALSTRNRLVTLTGPPGGGKTRLAVEWAGRRATDDSCRLAFIELTSTVDSSRVATAIGIALGLTERPGHAMEETLVVQLAGEELVLVLDNCEHVVTAVAKVVTALLDRCPRVRIVATSRRPIEVRGEQLCKVASLDVAPAVELFLDHARLVSSGAGADDRDRVVIEQICQLLGGLPLAIELAAAWTRVLTPQQILGELNERALSLLESSGHRQVLHHRTLEDAVDRSYELLEASQQQMFERLSVFVGGFDLEGARAVAPEHGPSTVLRLVTALVDHSLVLAEDGVVSPTPAKRYRLLEPLRQYGLKRLEKSGEGGVIRHRHAMHCLTLARRTDEALRGPRRWESLQRLDEEAGDLHQEVGNLQAALQWARDGPGDLELRLCAALAHWWALRGRANEGRVRLEQALQAETDDESLRATALSRASRFAYLAQNYEHARALLEESLAITDRLGDTLASARRRRNLAVVAMAQDDLDLAVDLCRESIAVFRLHDDGSGLAWSLAFLGFALHFKGDREGAEQHLEEALREGRECENVAVTGWSHGGLSLVAAAAGDVQSQRAHLKSYLDLVRRVDGVHQDADWLWVGFALASAEGRRRSALRLAAAAQVRGRREGTNINHRFRSSVLAELERVRHTVGPGAAALEDEGARMTQDQLIREALEYPSPRPSHGLTARQVEVAELVADGKSNRDIAESLVISARTVESHITDILRRLGGRRRTDIATWVVKELRSSDSSDSK